MDYPPRLRDLQTGHPDRMVQGTLPVLFVRMDGVSDAGDHEGASSDAPAPVDAVPVEAILEDEELGPEKVEQLGF